MANGYDVVNYEVVDRISGNTIYYTTNFSEIIDLFFEHPDQTEDWGVLAEIITINKKHVQIKISLETLS